MRLKEMSSFGTENQCPLAFISCENIKDVYFKELLVDFSFLSILPYQHRKNCSFLDYIDVLIVCRCVSHLKF